MPVDIKLDENILTKDEPKIKCAIRASKVREQTDYYIFRTRVLLFKVETKIRSKGKNQKWTVSRFENDFYSLRRILELTFG